MAQRPPPLQAKLPRPAGATQSPSSQATVNYQAVPYSIPPNQTLAQTISPAASSPQTQGHMARNPAVPGNSRLVPTVSRQNPPVGVPANRPPVISPSPGTQAAPTLGMPPRQATALNRPIPAGSAPVSAVNSRPIAPTTTTPRQNRPMAVPPIQTGNQGLKASIQPNSRPQPKSHTPSQSSRSTTPPPPPFSPILPPISKDEADKIASLLSNMDPYNPPRIIAKEPSSVPISESENTDVIALRAALSVLQMQKQTAARDIRSLEEMRDQALQDPEGYVRALLSRVNAAPGPSGGQKDAGLLNETLNFAVEGLWVKGVEENGTQHLKEAVRDPNADVDMEVASEEESGSESSSESEGDQKERKPKKKKEKFAAPPKPQNVFRMPPVNWSKYQVVGEGLDKLHESQRRRPTPGTPSFDPDADGELGGSEESHVIAAPYHPFLDQDRLKQAPGTDSWSPNVGPSGDHPMQTRRAARRHIG